MLTEAQLAMKQLIEYKWDHAPHGEYHRMCKSRAQPIKSYEVTLRPFYTNKINLGMYKEIVQETNQEKAYSAAKYQLEQRLKKGNVHVSGYEFTGINSSVKEVK